MRLKTISISWDATGAPEEDKPLPSPRSSEGQTAGESCLVECGGTDPCISTTHSDAIACLSSTPDETKAMACGTVEVRGLAPREPKHADDVETGASSTTTACPFGVEHFGEAAARATQTQHQTMTESQCDKDGHLAVPELGEWVEALIQDVEARVGPDESAENQKLSTRSTMMGALKSRVSFAVREAKKRTTRSDSSKATVQDCATSGSKEINPSLAMPFEGDSRARVTRRCGAPCPHPGARRHREGSRAPARFSGGDVSENGTSTQRARGPPARLVGLRPVEAHLRRKHRAGRRKAARPRRALACRARGDRGERRRRRRLSPRKGTRCCGLSTRGSAL